METLLHPENCYLLLQTDSKASQYPAWTWVPWKLCKGGEHTPQLLKSLTPSLYPEKGRNKSYFSRIHHSKLF